MAVTNLLDTKTVNLNETIGNGKKLFVPQFQRDYSWDEDNWEDLWNDTDEWAEAFSEEEYEKNLYRLGNYTLLEPKRNNKEAVAKPFNEKKEVYAESKYQLTRKIEAMGDWTPRAVNHRQAYLPT